MIRIYAYICLVKERLNLTIDGALLEAMKAYAASKEMSVSELVESYFRSVTRPVGRDNILDLVDRLEPPAASEARVMGATVPATATMKGGGGTTGVVEVVKGGGGHGF